MRSIACFSSAWYWRPCNLLPLTLKTICRKLISVVSSFILVAVKMDYARTVQRVMNVVILSSGVCMQHGFLVCLLCNSGGLGVKSCDRLNFLKKCCICLKRGREMSFSWIFTKLPFNINELYLQLKVHPSIIRKFNWNNVNDVSVPQYILWSLIKIGFHSNIMAKLSDWAFRRWSAPSLEHCYKTVKLLVSV